MLKRWSIVADQGIDVFRLNDSGEWCKCSDVAPLLDVLRCAEAWQEAYKGRWMKAFSSQNEINDSLIAVSNSEIDLFAAIERAKQEVFH
jgi:hypothetical protein